MTAETQELDDEEDAGVGFIALLLAALAGVGKRRR